MDIEAIVSKKYKIDPQGGVSIFQISLISKKSKISDRGRGQAYFGKSPKFSLFLIMMPPLSHLSSIILGKIINL